jgi:hypothetical protein
MKCMNCPLKYVGQTGRTFNTRCKEHIHAIRRNNANSGYSSHILRTGHNNRYYGRHKKGKEGQTFEYLGKVSHLQN